MDRGGSCVVDGAVRPQPDGSSASGTSGPLPLDPTGRTRLLPAAAEAGAPRCHQCIETGGWPGPHPRSARAGCCCAALQMWCPVVASGRGRLWLPGYKAADVMAAVKVSDRPCLAHGAVLRHDDTRRLDMVLAPERVVKLSPTAAAIMQLCDGSHTVADIVAALQARFAGSGIEDDVKSLVTQMTELGVLR